MGNNPVNFNDPTGHGQCRSQEDCEDMGTTVMGGSNGIPIGGSSGGDDDDRDDPHDPTDDPEIETLSKDHQCTNILGEYGGCISYFSVAIGLDAPTIMMLAGAGLSFVGLPQVGLPLALAGAAFEACAFTATPLCAAVKLLSVNVSATIDEYGNLYVGPQISWGKSILPFVAISDYLGTISSGNDSHVPTEAEVRDNLSGISFSAGTIGTGGISYSPFAQTYNTSYYIDGLPELFSVNANLNFLVYDFSP